MTDYEMLSIGIFFGGLMAMFFIGLGVVIEDVRHYFSDKDTTERGCVCDNGDDICIYRRNRSGSSDNRCFEQMDSETLATYIRTMISTGICPSNTEKQCLEEAASRIERSKA